jgi:RNA polymerase sigma-70 factor (ECF subfamily)
MGGIGSIGATAVQPDARHDLVRAYELHRQDVFRLALRYGAGRRSWAEDRTQDVFVRLIEVIDRLRDAHDLGAWLYRVTANVCISRLRRERFIALATLRFAFAPQEPATPEALAERNDDVVLAIRMLETLPPKERVAFTMHHLDGKTLDEIGEILGHSKGYVSKLVSRAESRLRKEPAK